MDYCKWSKLIYKYYFSNSQGKSIVLLHITMQDLVDFAKQEDVEIAPNRKASSLTDQLVRNDFIRKFYLDGKQINENLSDFIEKIQQIKTWCLKEEYYEGLLPIVAVLIMPICENDDSNFHGNEYYKHLFNFLIKNPFVLKIEENNNTFLKNIGLDVIWKNIDRWAESLDIPFKSNLVVNNNGAVQYVRSLMKESLLPPSKIQHFCVLFDRAGLVPRINIEDGRLLSAFQNNYSYIGITDAKRKLLLDSNYKQYLVSVLREEYENWDGVVKIKERNKQTGKTKVVSGSTCYPLFLYMRQMSFSDEFKFGFQLYSTDKEISEHMVFVSDSNSKELPEIFIKNDGYASTPFFIEDEELKSVIDRNNTCYSLHEKYDRLLTARFVVSEYYLLKSYRNFYVATTEFVKGEFYYVLIRHNSEKPYGEWLSNNKATLINDKVLTGKYSLFKIACASTPMDNRHDLNFKTQIRCKSVNNIEVECANESDTVLLSNLLPAYFEISGVDVSNDKIYAVSVNDEHRNSSELIYDHSLNLWVLKVFTNKFQLNKEFQLYCNENIIPYCRIYKFSDFVMPETFKELSLDKWGTGEGGDFVKGLELPSEVMSQNLINWDIMEDQMSKAKAEPLSNVKYKGKDLLLYAITSASYETTRWVITKQWLSLIQERILNDVSEEDTDFSNSRFALHNTLADYARMGYVNYIYSDDVFKITANHPTLILLNPQYERIINRIGNKKICRKECKESQYKCLLTGGRTIEFIEKLQAAQHNLNFTLEYRDENDLLMPQTIFVHSESREVFKQISEKFGIKYQDNIYANALLETLPTVFEYENHIKETGKEIDYEGVKNFRAIDYNKMAELYPQRIKERKLIRNSEINKDQYDMNNDIVTFFPGQKDEETLMISDRRMISVDKYWGHFIGMANKDAKVLQYDEDKARIYLPSQIRLPFHYARALTLLTGSTPDSFYGSRSYYIGVNPCTNSNANASDPNTILRKLGQNK